MRRETPENVQRLCARLVDLGEAFCVLSDLDCSRTVFVDADLRCAVFQACDFGETIFVDCDLRGTDFSRSKLHDVTFIRCALGAIDLPAAFDRSRMLDCSAQFPEAAHRGCRPSLLEKGMA